MEKNANLQEISPVVTRAFATDHRGHRSDRCPESASQRCFDSPLGVRLAGPLADPIAVAALILVHIIHPSIVATDSHLVGHAPGRTSAYRLAKDRVGVNGTLRNITICARLRRVVCKLFLCPGGESHPIRKQENKTARSQQQRPQAAQQIPTRRVCLRLLFHPV